MPPEIENAKEVLDRIQDIAQKASHVDGTPQKVLDALGEIISIARQRDVVNAGPGGQARTAPTFTLSGGSKLDGPDKLG